MSGLCNISSLWRYPDPSVNHYTAEVLIQEKVSVVACRESGPSAKAPYPTRGLYAASINPLMRKIWSRDHPGTVWGLPCALNNVLVLDADRHGNGDGVAILYELFKRHQFDSRSIPAVTTPRNGMHFYFGRPSGLGQTRGTLAHAVDIRDNAYVIAPGCRMADGSMYRLVEGTLEQFAQAIGTQSLPEPPEWMLPMLVHPHLSRRTSFVAPSTFDDETVKNQIKGLIKSVLQAEEGNRNRLLFWTACRFAELIRNRLVTQELAEMLLQRVGEELGLPAREICSTIRSGLRKAWEGDHHAR